MFDFQQYRQNFINATQFADTEKWSDLKNNPMFLCAPQLTDDHVKNCLVSCNRETLLELLCQQAIVAEVGTQYGEFAERIVSVTQPQKLHIIDIDLSLLEANLQHRENLSRGLENGSVVLHKGDSSTTIDTFPDSYFDWIYIDGDHSYEGVRKDIEKAYPKVKSDGLLIFNDYTHWSPYEMIPYGVPQAVNEFCLASDWELAYLALDNILSYQDVAIRRMK